MSPEDSGEFGDYCQYRLRSEPADCTALRLRLSDADAERYEREYQRCREGREAA